MRNPAAKTVRPLTAHTTHGDGIPQTLLFFILKKLETPLSVTDTQQDLLK